MGVCREERFGRALPVAKEALPVAMQGAQLGIAVPPDQLTMWISVDSRPSDHIGPHSLASTVRMPFNRTMNTAVMPLGNIQTPFAHRDTCLLYTSDAADDR